MKNNIYLLFAMKNTPVQIAAELAGLPQVAAQHLSYASPIMVAGQPGLGRVAVSMPRLVDASAASVQTTCARLSTRKQFAYVNNRVLNDRQLGALIINVDTDEERAYAAFRPVSEIPLSGLVHNGRAQQHRPSRKRTDDMHSKKSTTHTNRIKNTAKIELAAYFFNLKFVYTK
ncbi:hypothetical protein ACFOET_15260 [Parapedobacter deserti]|uniref:Uncharacterized protein n=1 Tax=Parapedobacter deserti TaxID=1912957 RepID=A0ABV7JS99_9SPHI